MLSISYLETMSSLSDFEFSSPHKTNPKDCFEGVTAEMLKGLFDSDEYCFRHEEVPLISFDEDLDQSESLYNSGTSTIDAVKYCPKNDRRNQLQRLRREKKKNQVPHVDPNSIRRKYSTHHCYVAVSNTSVQMVKQRLDKRIKIEKEVDERGSELVNKIQTLSRFIKSRTIEDSIHLSSFNRINKKFSLKISKLSLSRKAKEAKQTFTELSNLKLECNLAGKSEFAGNLSSTLLRRLFSKKTNQSNSEIFSGALKAYKKLNKSKKMVY